VRPLDGGQTVPGKRRRARAWPASALRAARRAAPPANRRSRMRGARSITEFAELRPLGICLAGPTASGKSALALQLAEALRPAIEVEIISVDSAQVYRGMDIGTAKPTAAERARVPQHLIDILEPEQSYSAARFVQDARALIDAIRARERLPLLVGGTMLYFKALRDGLDAMPAADAEVRKQIDARAAELGWPALHAELQQVDALTAARLAPHDAQRIQRALEVWHLTGQPLSALHTRRALAAPCSPNPWPLIALEPGSRAWLHERIARRFDTMLAAGFVDEVRQLRQRPGLRPDMPSMRCVGYRQAWAALDSGRFEMLRDSGIAATRQLAKRQMTWLRSMPQRTPIECDGPGAAAQMLAAVRGLLA
jgi:tRNA dimethylallyltransferase